MIFSTSFSTRVIIFLATFICLSGCAAQLEPPTGAAGVAPDGESGLKIAVFPIVNYSATPAPLNRLNQLLVEGLDQSGLNILTSDLVNSVLSRHRIRYLAGINEKTTLNFKNETGAEAVLITWLEFYSDAPPPKIALTSRLVSTGKQAKIIWMSGVGLSGDDSPGLLDINLIEDPQKLQQVAIQDLVGSLSHYLSDDHGIVEAPEARNKYQPRVAFRSPILDPAGKYRLAVIPFYNISERKYGGDIIALQFIQGLKKYDNFYVIEPGIVRQTLLDVRIIMGDGISFSDADLLFRRLDADLILSGRIMDYQDYQGPAGRPIVDFSAQIMERKSREVVWAIQSYNQGDDRVYFFDWGKVNTAHAMAAQMVELAVENLVE